MSKNYVTSFRGENFYTPDSKIKIKKEVETPRDDDFGDHHFLDNSFDNEHIKMRKSLSMNDIAALRQDLMALGVQEDTEDVYQRYRRPTNAPQELSKSKYVSMAEAIYHFERDTPGRFHSGRPQKFNSQGFTGPSGLTIPQSPMLRCKARSRPVHVMSQKEKEEMELEEIKKFQIKANPIPKSVLEGSRNLPNVPRKPNTVPEPFKLTEIHKKQVVIESPEQVNFKARPAPKHILEKPQVPPKPPVQITQPVTPKFHYHQRAKSQDLLHVTLKNMNGGRLQRSAEKPNSSQPRQGPIRPVPFSFERRDEEMKRRKEERIKQQIEEERKQASLFKAQPLPGAVKKQMRTATTSESASTHSASSENKENHLKFKAKPPVILYKEPFKPVHQQNHMLKIKPFNLATENRACDREKFNKHLKEKEEEQERLRKQKEKEMQEAEERAKAELREKLVHHAKPVPKEVKKPYIPEKSVVPLTVPETPKFVRRLKQH